MSRRKQPALKAALLLSAVCAGCGSKPPSVTPPDAASTSSIQGTNESARRTGTWWKREDGGASVDAPVATTPDAASAPDVSVDAADGAIADDAPLGKTPPIAVDAAMNAACTPGQRFCSGVCVSLEDPAHCGGCGQRCAGPANPHGRATCSVGVCGIACNVGYHLCGSSCLSNTDVKSCGAACTPCAKPLRGYVECDGVQCVYSCRQDTPKAVSEDPKCADINEP